MTICHRAFILIEKVLVVFCVIYTKFSCYLIVSIHNIFCKKMLCKSTFCKINMNEI